jgi:hypothetical protein
MSRVISSAFLLVIVLAASEASAAGCTKYWPDACCHATASGFCVDGGKFCECEQQSGTNGYGGQWRGCQEMDEPCLMVV